MTFRNLARHNEITVLRAAGITTYKMAILLLPVITAIALFQFVLKDQITPRTERALSVWWQATQLHRSEEHTSELQSLMRISYAVFCLTKKQITTYKFNQHC